MTLRELKCVERIRRGERAGSGTGQTRERGRGGLGGGRERVDRVGKGSLGGRGGRERGRGEG